jgi:nucleotide-binding universal stress UspA family protein
MNIKKILCPTDLSPESDEALRYAVALTRAYGAKLFILYCNEGNTDASESEISATDNGLGRLFAESLAPHLAWKTQSRLDWEGVVVSNPVEIGKTIVNQAAKRGADLIVMRSRRRPASAALLGSTAETVCRTAPCPVLVTHPREREWVGLTTGEIDLHRILVAYDFSSDAEVALKHALSLSQEYQTDLHLLHVLTKAGVEEPELDWVQKIESTYTAAARKLQRAIPPEAFLWCRILTSVRWGKTYQEVLTYARENKIDLICLGASGSDFSMGALFGSNVDRILRQAPCPVLIARPIKPAGPAIQVSSGPARTVSKEQRGHARPVH